MAKIRIGALGGLGENGKNLLIVEVNEHIFILDAGLKYPDIDMYGVDAVVPDMNYLINNSNKIEGIFISHGHEDHIGALPYLLENLNIPVFGTHFTICLIEDLLTESHLNIKKYKLYRINENKVLSFDDVTVSFFNTTHSIPESIGIAINTSDGSIVYATDFTFGFATGGKYQTSFDKITDLGKNGVLIALAESIGSTTVQRITNDTFLEYAYKKVLSKTKGRVIVSAFSSDLSRIQKIIDLSVNNGKDIAIIGRRAQRIIDIAISSGYLQIPQNKLINLKYIDENNNNESNNLVAIVTGVRHEPYSILSRMATGIDRLIHLNSNDTVVIMSPPVPGTEKNRTDTVNVLYKNDIDVQEFTKDILKSTHASPEDLKLLYSMLKPKYILPIKGEYRHLYQHSEIAKECGFHEDNLIILENGDFVNIIDQKITEIDKIEVKDILIDGSSGSINEDVLKERELLSEEGIYMVVGTISTINKKIVIPTQIHKKGFITNNEEMDEKVIETATKILEGYLVKKKFDLNALKNAITEETTKIVFRYTRKKPIVVSHIIEVKQQEKKLDELNKNNQKKNIKSNKQYSNNNKNIRNNNTKNKAKKNNN